MQNKQRFSDIGNPQVNVDARQEKAADPFQMLAFDTSRKINSLVITVVILVMVNIITLYFVAQEQLSQKSQYDSLRYIAKEMKTNLEILKDFSKIEE